MSTKQQYHRRKMRESLEIKKVRASKRRKVLNRDKENLIKTNTWISLFVKLTEEESNRKN